MRITDLPQPPVVGPFLLVLPIRRDFETDLRFAKIIDFKYPWPDFVQESIDTLNRYEENTGSRELYSQMSITDELPSCLAREKGWSPYQYNLYLGCRGEFYVNLLELQSSVTLMGMLLTEHGFFNAISSLELAAKRWTKTPAPKKQTYLMIDKKRGLVKIGRSHDPVNRLKAIRRHYPSTRLIATCASDVEKQLHRSFKGKRVHGEWFKLSGLDIDQIVLTCNFITHN